jgi:hypothetical protein|tara:strand:- start:257 stop:427 length:171 start_codon:yes stop_codon:yes gene_type:complete
MNDKKAWGVKTSGLFCFGSVESFDRFTIAKMRLRHDCAVKKLPTWLFRFASYWIYG